MGSSVSQHDVRQVLTVGRAAGAISARLIGAIQPFDVDVILHGPFVRGVRRLLRVDERIQDENEAHSLRLKPFDVLGQIGEVGPQRENGLLVHVIDISILDVLKGILVIFNGISSRGKGARYLRDIGSSGAIHDSFDIVSTRVSVATDLES